MGQWPFHRRVCLKTIASVRGPAAEMYSLCLFERIHGIGSLVEICCSFFCEQVGFKRFALFLVENCQEHTVIYRVSCTSRFSIFENRLNTNVFFAFIKAKRVLVPSQATKKAKHRGISAPVQKLKRKRETNVIFCMLQHFEIGQRVDTTVLVPRGDQNTVALYLAKVVCHFIGWVWKLWFLFEDLRPAWVFEHIFMELFLKFAVRFFLARKSGRIVSNC